MSLLPTILLIDDGADDRELLSLLLRGAFGEVTIEEVSDPATLARAISAGRFGVVLTEHELSWIRSGDVLRLIHDLRPDCPVVVVTDRPLERVAAEILHLAPDGLIPKTASGLAGLPHTLRGALLAARRHAAAESSEPVSRRLLDALPAGVFVVSAQGTIEDANPALARILGFASAEDCVQRAFTSMFAVAADADLLRSSLAAGEGHVALEARLRRNDGSTVWARVTLWHASGGSGGLQGLVEDRAAAVASGADLAGHPAALTSAPAELENMAYVVSHDLRQPLTQVVRFLDLIAQESTGRVGKDAQALVAQARESAGRLESMVEAVLRLARIESHGKSFEAIDLEALLSRVLARLESELAATHGQITHDPLPPVRGDEAQLEMLFENLLDNALKFHGPDPPRIRIEVRDDGECWHLGVRDNGIGIDFRDAERIFVMFQRLHTADEVPGTGIGLALCRRVVARHGGRIWVESRPREGATFHFTLAKRPPASLHEARGSGR